ncbi:transketolase [Gulosibacter chungangensis]|uniref:Transketolase n=1 Tax=Gulosibacter chungangensis TaxID=979746 RepID=A0A7J5BDJ9_9MICO|nr:transketolase [Gulosibacter chungangensis]KAB1644122.1 transketolase [Gulosibacter chungangensis]
MTNIEWTELDKRAADTARLLAADAVEKAKGGHPGTAMSLAPVATLLYQHVMNVDPTDKDWIGRDRFILSNGHTSLTQYTQLFLGGFGLELDDIKNIRSWGSPTAGHPEYGHVDHVEMTTGPLGQGLATAVGFAYSQRFERGLFDPEAPEGTSPFDHYVYVLAGDGCIQEGVTSEASSLAGHQQLGNLIVIYDANQISIEDDTDISFTEDVAKRYEAYGWDVRTVDWIADNVVNEDVPALAEAIAGAKAVKDKPSIIVLKNFIGYPAPNAQNTGASHGAALGAEEIRATKEILGFNPDEDFAVPADVFEYTRGLADRVRPKREQWQASFDDWAAREPERKALFDRLEAGELPENIEAALPSFEGVAKVSTRKASGKTINALAEKLPELWGGSADLAGSNNTTIEGAKSFIPAEHSTSSYQGDKYGRVLHFGIREHAMAAILNGITLGGRTRAFGGTFLIFSDYMRPALRLAALMNIPTTFVWTHDSIALGGDGPTHQPVETLTTLRAIPNFTIVRPADGAETAQAWLETLRRNGGPIGLVLSRQDLPVFERGTGAAAGDELASASFTSRGGYILAEARNGAPEVVLIATGSEVQLAVAAREILEAEGVATRVVSMPSQEWFAEQSAEYQEEVLPAAVTARVSVEAGLALTWAPYLGTRGRSVSVEEFGASADGDELLERYGITTDAVVAAARESLAAN